MIVPKDGGRHKSAAIINGAWAAGPMADNPDSRLRGRVSHDLSAARAAVAVGAL